jgi:hypothetical protein
LSTILISFGFGWTNINAPPNVKPMNVVRNQHRMFGNFRLISILAFVVAIVSCGNKEEQAFRTKKRIATCQKNEQGRTKYEILLFADSTFYLKSKSADDKESSGTFKVLYSRYYFVTNKGKNHLCEFYYCDSAKHKLWPFKGCDEDYMDIEFLN